MPETDESSYLRELRERDDNAWRRFHREDLPAVEAGLYVKLGGIDDQELREVIQEALARLWMQDYFPSTRWKLRKWLVTVAGNFYLDRVRARQRRKEFGKDDAEELSALASHEPPLVDARNAEQIRDALEHCLAELDSDLGGISLREAFVRYRLNKDTLTAIGHGLSVSYHTFRNRLLKGVVRIGKCVQKKLSLPPTPIVA